MWTGSGTVISSSGIRSQEPGSCRLPSRAIDQPPAKLGLRMPCAVSKSVMGGGGRSSSVSGGCGRNAAPAKRTRSLPTLLLTPASPTTPCGITTAWGVRWKRPARSPPSCCSRLGPCRISSPKPARCRTSGQAATCSASSSPSTCHGVPAIRSRLRGVSEPARRAPARLVVVAGSRSFSRRILQRR